MVVGGVCTYAAHPRNGLRLTGRIDWWTIKAVGQEDFEDVKVPDAPAKKVQS